jgi:ElaB/YqjD/DUF883 family membrane-anchored ribosome-binding protein
MACENCGKENNPDSKFCRFCGASLLKGSKTHFHISKSFWKAPLFLIIISVIGAGLLFWGGTRAYAYYQVDNKISTAKKLQQSADYAGSISALSETSSYSMTAAQAQQVSSIKSDDARFEGYLSTYNDAASQDTSSSSVVLLKNQQQLQAINTDYPAYKNVQTELTKIQTEIVTSLQAEAAANGESAAQAKAQAEKSLQEATADRADKAEAQAEAENAESSADTTQATNTDNAFINQLTTIYNDYISNCYDNISEAITAYQSGNTTTESVYLGGAASSCAAAESDAKALNSNYTNMSQDYIDAATDMEYAGYYQGLALDDFSTSDFTDAVTNADDASTYQGYVKTALGL